MRKATIGVVGVSDKPYQSETHTQGMGVWVYGINEKVDMGLFCWFVVLCNMNSISVIEKDKTRV